MAYVDRYGAYLEGIPSDIERLKSSGKHIVLGYTSNYDVVLVWDTDTYNSILAEHLKGEPSASPGETISSMEDFARITSAYAIKGLGGAFDITDIAVCRQLQSSFKTESSLGGTCAQGATALSTLGFPVNVHITDKSKEVCELMGNPGVTVIGENGMRPILDGASDEPPIYHFILQFTKGDIIKINGKEYEIPLSNRLILPYDKVQKIVPVDMYFKRYWESNASGMYAYLVSGFDAINDESIMRERGAELARHIEAMRAMDKGFKIYFEGAYYINKNVETIAEHTLCPLADIYGMNEEELIGKMDSEGVKLDTAQPADVIAALERVMSKYSIRSIVLHTKDYALYYGKEPDIDIEKGLTMGNLMSGTRARIGRYGNQEDCAGTLELPLSKRGLDFAENLDKTDTKGYALAVPSRYMERPKYTIGLGDTFVAGMHTCFVK